MQNVRRGHAARERAVDVDRLGIDHIFNADHRRYRNGAFIDSVRRDMRVAIDDARNQVLASGVDDLSAGGHHDLLAHVGDLAILDDD